MVTVPTLPQLNSRRELSGFEVVEKTNPPKTPLICSKCHALGHARTSRLCPLRYAELRQRPLAESEQHPLQCSAISSHVQKRLVMTLEQLEMEVVAGTQGHDSMTKIQSALVTALGEACWNTSMEPLSQVSVGAVAPSPTHMLEHLHLSIHLRPSILLRLWPIMILGPPIKEMLRIHFIWPKSKHPRLHLHVDYPN